MLDLSFNNIRHISRVSTLGNCHTLYFVQNKIAGVRPDDLQGPIAQSLRSLELGGNRLRSMENLGHLAQLQELWVGKNKITSMDVRAAFMRKLTRSISRPCRSSRSSQSSRTGSRRSTGCSRS